MLIFTLPSWYKSEKYPENSIFIYEQMQAIRAAGHKVVVLSVQPVAVQTLKKPDMNIKKIVDNGITTYYIEIPVIKPSKFRSLYVWTFRKALNKLICRATEEFGMPDVYYAHFTFAAGYAALDLKGNIPLVVEEHYSGLMGKLDSKFFKYIKATIAGADKFICVSDGLKKAVCNITGKQENIIVVTNMINPCFEYRPEPERKDFVFFSMGSLIKRKGFDLLIQAFSEEFSDDENVFLRIGGSGEEKNNLLKLINKYNMSHRIKLIGQLSRYKTFEEYINCNCFVLASRAETYGLVYREAMAVGRPIVSTKHGGFGDNWTDKCGKLVDVNDIEQLKSAMRYIYTNYEKYDGKYISELCLKECSSVSVTNQIIEIFKSVINKRS